MWRPWHGGTVTVDAVVIGGGINGLVAATVLARAGWSVEVLEQAPVAGGAVGSDVSPLGYVHDWGSAFYGVLHTSPVLRELGTRHTPFRGPVPTSRWRACSAKGRRPPCCTPTRSAPRTGWDPTARRGASCGSGGRARVPACSPPSWPRCRHRCAWRGQPGRRSARSVQLARTVLEPLEAHAAYLFGSESARMLLAGHATHADVPVDGVGSTPPALLLAMAAQQHGMPVPVGGASTLALALVQAAESAGVVVRTGVDVVQVVVRGGRAVGVRTAEGGGVRARRAVLFNGSPHVLARDLVGEHHLPGPWLRQLGRHRYGSGFFRVDVDLDRPAPWADARVQQASSSTSPATSTSWRSARRRCAGGCCRSARSWWSVSRTGPTRPGFRRERPPVGGVPLPGPPGGGAARLGAAADRACARPAGGARPGPARGTWSSSRPGRRWTSAPRPGARRGRRRRRVGVVGPAVGAAAGGGLVAVRRPGGGPVPVRGLGRARRWRARDERAERGRDRAAAGATGGAQPLGLVMMAPISKCMGSVYFQSPPQRKPQRLKIATTSGSIVPRMPR